MLEKILSIAMLPFGLLIILEELGLFTINLFFDTVLIGATLMIVIQILTLISLNIHHKNIRIVNYVTAVVLLIPVAIYLLSTFITVSFQESLPLIIGVMMFVESLYAFH